ncbi:hypothetical protein [Ulvibacter litoralis]|uniref:Uncharacterized protein n=1 Tax=Ulvibacter litoralis TaxID=227084 RepID=A0A1G7F4T3_9FLAO|nr:hypothetical protein [Ulvibacter litoralis]GHC52675.1 hypothetical protein GCM10008083_15710 [Ulvibacter litoralis]SDE70887.1 hypothetical protein SAMN05421855_102331 [Ulvibacter litoralis]
MNKLMILLMVLFGVQVASSQNLTVNQLLELSESNLAEVQEKLTADKWYFFHGRDASERRFGDVKFVYDTPDLNNPGNGAKYFLYYYYSDFEKAKAVEISFRIKEAYDLYVKQIENLKFKLVSSTTEKGNILKVYKKGGFIIEVTLPPNFDDGKSYKFLFAEKSDYKKYRD